jgi:hypothetical protein
MTTGKVVWTTNQIISEGFLSKEITWDGKDDFGNRIGKGVYIYKLTVKSTLTNQKLESLKTCDNFNKTLYLFNEPLMRKLILLQAAYSVFFCKCSRQSNYNCCPFFISLG